MSTTVLSMLQTTIPPPKVLHVDDGSSSPSYNPSKSTLITPPTSHDPLTAFIPNPVPRYLHKYHHIYDAVQSVQSIVSEWKPANERGSFELECRFGVWQGQYFENGVTKLFIEKILSMFDTFTEWKKITDWEETHDYYYANGKDTSAPMVRTTASFKVDPKTGRKSIQTQHMRKYQRAKIDFKYMGPLSDFHYDLRVGLNYEENVSEQELPSIVNPSSVRIKSRKSFYYTSEDFPSIDPIWRFDITRSWTGYSRTDAELKQRKGETTYEFELECLNPRALMVTPKHDSFYVACSMLLKMKDFMDTTEKLDFKWEPIQRIPQTFDVACF